MKKGCFLLVLMLVGFGCSNDAENGGQMVTETDDEVTVEATVSIPDSAFEQALIDLDFDNTLDGKVLKNSIDFVTELQINDKGITDLTGIAEFDQLENLNVRGNELTSLDVTNNLALKFIWAEDNELESFSVDGLVLLEKIGVDRNNLDVISIRTNGALQLLTASGNSLISIDVSNNNALTDFIITDNPLNCILVNQSQLDAIPVDWSKDEEDSYALDCE